MVADLSLHIKGLCPDFARTHKPLLHPSFLLAASAVIEAMFDVHNGDDLLMPQIPDNLTLAQFIMDHDHDIRPARGKIPAFIEDTTGERISLETVRYSQRRMYAPLKGLRSSCA